MPSNLFAKDLFSEFDIPNSSSGGITFDNIFGAAVNRSLDITPGIDITTHDPFNPFNAGTASGQKDWAGIPKDDALANDMPGGPTASTGGSFLDNASGFIAQFAVIILGFIFVAVGLSMFRDNGLIIRKPA